MVAEPILDALPIHDPWFWVILLVSIFDTYGIIVIAEQKFGYADEDSLHTMVIPAFICLVVTGGAIAFVTLSLIVGVLFTT